MVEVQIGAERRSLETVETGWLIQQIRNRRAREGQLCVQVMIDTPQMRLRLTTPRCAGSGGSNRPPTLEERAVMDSWERHHPNQADFPEGQLAAFLEQLRRFI
jgi:hypothetical protein